MRARANESSCCILEADVRFSVEFDTPGRVVVFSVEFDTPGSAVVFNVQFNTAAD